MASVIKVLPKDVVFRPFVHLYSTLLPQVRAAKLKPRLSASRESHPSEDLSELPPKLEHMTYHCILTGSLRNSRYHCFVVGWVPLAAFIGRLLCGKPAQVGLGASSRVAVSVRERISVAGCDRVRPVFFKVRQGAENNPLTTKPSS